MAEAAEKEEEIEEGLRAGWSFGIDLGKRKERWSSG